MTRVEFVPGWEEHLAAPQAELLEHLGVEIEADMRDGCPVRTGHLRDSIGHEVDGDTVRVAASASYAAYVVEGHRIVAWGHDTGRYEPPNDFMRPALYKPRGA